MRPTAYKTIRMSNLDAFSHPLDIRTAGSLNNGWNMPQYMSFHTSILFIAATLALAGAGQAVGTNVVPPTAVLSQRAYPVDPVPFFRAMRRTFDTAQKQSDAALLRSYFKQNQIDLSPPSSVKFDLETGSVVVNSTAENLAKVEVLLPAPPAQLVLFSRVYRFSSNDVFSKMRHSMGGPEGQSEFEVLRNFFKSKGVDLSPPSSLFYTYGEKCLIVRATEANLATIDKLVAGINSGK